MFPKPRLYKRGYLRLRVCSRDFTPGDPGGKQTTERHNPIMAAWGANSRTLPEGFSNNENQKMPQFSVDPAGVVTIADLMATTIAEEPAF